MAVGQYKTRNCQSQESFVYIQTLNSDDRIRCRGMLLANLWYGADAENFTPRKKGLQNWIRNKINVHKLSKYINKYQEQDR